jgi:hypothetical protein
LAPTSAHLPGVDYVITPANKLSVRACTRQSAKEACMYLYTRLPRLEQVGWPTGGLAEMSVEAVFVLSPPRARKTEPLVPVFVETQDKHFEKRCSPPKAQILFCFPQSNG